MRACSCAHSCLKWPAYPCTFVLVCACVASLFVHIRACVYLWPRGRRRMAGLPSAAFAAGSLCCGSNHACWRTTWWHTTGCHSQSCATLIALIRLATSGAAAVLCCLIAGAEPTGALCCPRPAIQHPLTWPPGQPIPCQLLHQRWQASSKCRHPATKNAGRAS